MAKLVDLLDEDKPLAEQKFVCLSFISPEKVIQDKNLFLFQEFTKQYNFIKSAELLTQYTNYISYKYNISSDDLINDMQEFSKAEIEKLRYSVNDDYKTFIDKNEDDLEKTYLDNHKFQTSVRGIKVRGVFPTQQEAELRCKMLREVDPNHDVYVGPVGIWVPFHPEAYKTGRVEYLEKELNELMHEKQKNEDKARSEFDNRVKESKLNAINENMKQAEEHGNKLTQTINEKGELISVENTNTTEKSLGVNATMDEIRNELFEGDNIVTTSTDHGLKDIMDKKNNDKDISD